MLVRAQVEDLHQLAVAAVSNKFFGRWGEVFGDDTVAAAMIDRHVHHADVLSLKRDGAVTLLGV
ncbi:ATP-binding protein [Streptomyces sp. NBC_01618]|uniref:ATP-binding protein n=1 Tax=Streptomyces sp. NBC_01618 TaxID=2975900 RepID=UPI00386E0B20|nr:ATP-binding protein [Streptomyces sp. NBC_01618]